MGSPALRELLAPWIEDAQFDKVTRVLEFTIRRVPELATPAAACGRALHPSAHGVRARITFPAHERDARGRYRTPTYKIAVAIEVQAGTGSYTRRVYVDRYAA